MNSRLLFFEKYHNYKIGDRQIRVGDEESDFPGFGGKFTRLMQLEKPSLIKNVRFGFVLDNLETRLSLSDSRTKIKFKVGLDENTLVEIQPKNSFLDPDKMSFVFEDKSGLDLVPAEYLMIETNLRLEPVQIQRAES